MDYGILGPVRACSPDGEPVALGGPGARSLLALLLLDAGHIVPIGTLIDGLYGEDPPAGAANALQSHVSRLRGALRAHSGGRDLVGFHATGYRVEAAREAVDAHRFERLARDGRTALAAGDHAVAASVLDEALALWRGPALADVPHAGARAARLEELRVGASEDHAQARLALGAARDVVPGLRVLVEAHPLRERPRGLLMRALAASGRVADALAVYEDARRLLADELGTDPSPELAAVHVAVLRGDHPGPVSVLSRAAPPDTDAPAFAAPPGRLTELIGREDELARLAGHAGAARLSTLTGPGGTGKTRLAIEVAARTTDDVCFVDLTRAVDDAAVPHAVAHALGIREATGVGARAADADMTARVVAVLAERCLMLILDNCEHVVGAAATLTERVLTGCPRVRVLATSREQLGITGEMLCPVPQLALPAPDADADALVAAPAIRLFVERAVAVRPDFVLTPVAAPAVARICAALDGLPLAIELAAARLRTLTLADVDARLGDRFRLLSRGSRTASPRHRTLHAVVEWSWDLLEPDERLLARRFTVFAGGAALAAVAAVCGLATDDADDLLAGLAEKSLVSVDDDGRYRMLETVRAFGADRLVEAGEAEALRRAHAEYFLALATEADAGLRSQTQLVWLARLEVEAANTDVALRWAVRADPVLALRLHAVLTWSWWLGGSRGRCSARSAELFDALAGRTPRDPDFPEGLDEEYVLCVVNAASVDPQGVGVEAGMDAAAAVMAGYRRPLRHAALMVQWALVGGPDRSTALDVHERQVGDDPWCRAVTLLGTGYSALFTGDVEAGREPLARAAEGFRALGDRWGLANVLDPLARIAEWRGDPRAALAAIDQAVDLAAELGAPEDLSDFLVFRGDMALRADRIAAALADFTRAEGLARHTGMPLKVQSALRGLGDAARRSGDPGMAERLYRQALFHDDVETNWFQENQALALVGLGRIAADGGDPATARARYLAALDAALSPPTHAGAAASAVQALAALATRSGDGDRAAGLLGAATTLHGGARLDRESVEAEARARALLTPDAFEAAHARGAALPREDAIRLARASG